MPHICARTPDDVLLALYARHDSGEAKKVLEIDFGKHLVAKYLAHREERTTGAKKRDMIRRSIVGRLERGETWDAICSLENASLRFVLMISRAWAVEKDVRARVATPSSPAVACDTRS